MIADPPSDLSKARGPFHSLRTKFVLAVSLLLLLTLGATAMHQSVAEQRLLKEGQIAKARALGEFVALSSPGVIYAFDITTLDRFVQQIMGNPDVIAAVIRNADGMTMTTQPRNGFPATELNELLSGDTLTDELSVMHFPIRDEGVDLGELIIVLDHTRLYRLIQTNLWRQLAIYLGIILFLDLVLFFIFRVNVLSPLNLFMQGANRIGRGDFRRPVPVSSHDELGRLASCFNTMMEEIGADREALVTTNARLATEIEHRRKISSQLDLLSQAIEQSPASVIITDPRGGIEYVNPQFSAITGFKADDVMREPSQSAATHVASPPFELGLADRMAAARPWKGEVENRHKDGSTYWTSTSLTPIKSTGENISHYLVIQEDITERKRHEQSLLLAASVFTHAREGIIITDASAAILDVNAAFTHITGYARDEVIGRNPRMLQSGRQDSEVYQRLWVALREKGHWDGEIWNKRKNGEVFPESITISAVRDASGDLQHYVALFTDISAQKEQQRRLEQTAHYDALTGLPNRVLLADRMHQAIAHARRRDREVAVIYLDLDGFKEINDEFGHEIGDQLLIGISDHMGQVVREEDTIARIGGDEFVAVLTDLGDVDECMPLLKRLLGAASRPVHVNDLSLQVSASLGVALYSREDGEQVDADQLLRRADQAMYQAKLAGKNRYHIFDNEKDRNAKGLHESLESIRQALAKREFELYYQPKVNMRTGQLVGAEALLRWRHPQRGLLLPELFLPVVDEHPLSVELGEWVLDEALNQITAWQEQGTGIQISVNVSGRHLQQADFVDRLRALLAAHAEIPPENLMLEILETNALADIDQVSRVIRACNDMGVRFALDDFGTGYSSLTYLKRLPADQLKIDRSFVRDMLDDPDDMAILDGILGLASAFQREAVAEGVESVEHGRLLLQLGCEVAQGFTIAPPMPPSDFAVWRQDWQPNPLWRQTRMLHRDEHPRVLAAVQHRAWIRQAVTYLMGSRERPPLLDHQQCRLGRWLEGAGRLRYGEEENFQLLREAHRDVHSFMLKLVKLKEGGRLENPAAHLPDLYAKRDRLLATLQALD